MSRNASGKRTKVSRGALGVAAALIAAAAAACGTSPGPSATPIGTPPVPGIRTPTAGSASPQPPTSAQVGADCAMLPPRGSGSVRSMATRQALSAAAANSQLSVFTAAVRAAGLEQTLNAKQSATLMIPANSAFASLSKADINHLHNS